VIVTADGRVRRIPEGRSSMRRRRLNEPARVRMKIGATGGIVDSRRAWLLLVSEGIEVGRYDVLHFLVVPGLTNEPQRIDPAHGIRTKTKPVGSPRNANGIGRDELTRFGHVVAKPIVVEARLLVGNLAR